LGSKAALFLFAALDKLIVESERNIFPRFLFYHVAKQFSMKFYLQVRQVRW